MRPEARMGAGVELGRMSRARHGLYLAISRALVDARARYTLPPYEDMGQALLHPQRPRGEGQPFMPPFLQKGALAL